MLNRVAVIGRLARDPELKRTQSGVPVLSFDLAVERNYKTRDGEKITDWVPCVAWKNHAEFLAKYSEKGAQVAVDGRLESRKWSDRNGQNHVAWEVIVDGSYIVANAKRDDTARSSNAAAESYDSREYEPYGGAGSADFQEIEDDGDVPF